MLRWGLLVLGAAYLVYRNPISWTTIPLLLGALFALWRVLVHLMNSKGCAFCSIRDGKLPSRPVRVAHDDFSAFCDIRPLGETHVLLIPKRHRVTEITHPDVDPALLRTMYGLARGICAELSISPNEDDTLMFFMAPPFNSVFHLHLHIVSRPNNSVLMSLIKLQRMLGLEYPCKSIRALIK